MSKTQQKLNEAKKKQASLIEKKANILKELSTVGSSIASLEKQLEREKINDGIVMIKARGFTIDDILDLMEKEKLEKQKL